MTTEGFYGAWTDTRLRQRIVEYVRLKTRKLHNYEMQQDLIQEGWIAISLERDDADHEHLYLVAKKSIDAVYKREWRYQEHVRRYVNPAASRYPGRIP